MIPVEVVTEVPENNKRYFPSVVKCIEIQTILILIDISTGYGDHNKH